MQLDHVIVAVSDLNAAVSTFETMIGAPAALHSVHPRGTENALFVFSEGPYLELLALAPTETRGTSARALERRLAERGEGLHTIALVPDDLDDVADRLRREGFDITGPVENGATNADGRRRTWRAVVVNQAEMQGAFLIQHYGWDWRSALARPAAGVAAVRGIHHVAYDLADASDVSSWWESSLGLLCTDVIVSERMGAQVLVHQAGTAAVEFVRPTRKDGPVAQRMAERGSGLAGLAFLVDDIGAAVTRLTAAGVRLSEPAAGVLPDSRVARIDPASAHGVAVQLLQLM